MRKCLVGVVLVASGFACWPLSAKETRVGSDPDSFNRRWLRDLKSDDFRVREEACARIAEAGFDAIAPLKEAAEGMDRETAARSLGMLERLTQSNDVVVSRTARDALAALEDSKNDAVADVARSVLVKLEKLPAPLPPRYSFGANGFNMRLQIQGGNGLRISTRSVNGDRTMTIEEPGKTTTITDSQGKNIRVTVTESVNGAEKTTEYQGNDLDDLRRKSPAGAEIYERFNRQTTPADAQKRLDELKARSVRIRTLSQESLNLSRERIQLRREGKEGTPEYADLEKRYQQNRDAQLQELRR